MSDRMPLGPRPKGFTTAGENFKFIRQVDHRRGSNLDTDASDILDHDGDGVFNTDDHDHWSRAVPSDFDFGGYQNDF